MAENKRRVEVFTAECPMCEPMVAMVKRLACPSCEVDVLDVRDEAVAGRARELGVRAVPAVAVDGKIAECCSAAGPTEEGLRAAGIGQAD